MILTWQAKIVAGTWHDADTLVDVTLDIGWGVLLTRNATVPLSIRLTSVGGPINAPEITGPESQAGLLVRDWIQKFAPVAGSNLWLISRSIDHDVHGRTVGQVVPQSPDGQYGMDIGTTLMAHGLAKPCKPDGARIPFTPNELALIIASLTATPQNPPPTPPTGIKR